MRCEEAADYMMDLLYDESGADNRPGRSALQEHVASCSHCQQEMKAFQKVRTAYRDVLLEEPPSGLRARIVVAAEQELRKQTTKPAWSFWTWLRGHWVLPTLATAGAVAIFLVTSPLRKQTPKSLSEASEETAQEVEKALPSPPPTSHPGVAHEEPDLAIEARERMEAPPDEAPFDSKSPLGGSIGRGHSLRRRSAYPASGAGGGGGYGLGSSRSGTGVSAPASPARVNRQANVPEGSDVDRGTRAAGAARFVPSPPASREPADSADPLRGDYESAAAESAAPAASLAGSRGRGATQTQFSLTPLITKADTAYRERRWAEAVTIYTELLRLGGRDSRASTWRQRLTAASRMKRQQEADALAGDDGN